MPIDGVKGAVKMTRELLLEYICPSDFTDVCVLVGCEHCEVKLNELLDEYDKHVIEQYKEDTNLKDTIRDIHDNVAKEMYCKGIDDFLTEICKMIVQSERNGNYRFYAVEIKQSIADLAEELKAGDKE